MRPYRPHRDSDRNRPQGPGSSGRRPFSSGSRPNRPAPSPRRQEKPKGPALFNPKVPPTRKSWKAMYTGTIKRLSRCLARHARELADMDDHELLAAAEALPMHRGGRRGQAIRLVRKLGRLRGQKPAAR